MAALIRGVLEYAKISNCSSTGQELSLHCTAAVKEALENLQPALE